MSEQLSSNSTQAESFDGSFQRLMLGMKHGIEIEMPKDVGRKLDRLSPPGTRVPRPSS